MDFLNQFKFGAIDIGSNAVRFQISKVMEEENAPLFKRVEYLRFPLRFGEDVFSEKPHISPQKEEDFVKLMRAYKLLLELYEVDDFMACATSAMREAENGERIVQRVQDEVGLKIDIIDGDKEAEIINAAIIHFIDEKNYVHIDVGGGSTEINIFVNRNKIGSYSFRLGSVRTISPAKETSEWNELGKWLKEKTKPIKGEIIAIGTGGNINKICEINDKNANKISLKEIEKVKYALEHLSYKERVHQFNLNEDRADVIIPAANIYMLAMEAANAKQIMIPKVGLREGIINLLYRKHSSHHISHKARFTH